MYVCTLIYIYIYMYMYVCTLIYIYMCVCVFRSRHISNLITLQSRYAVAKGQHIPHQLALALRLDFFLRRVFEQPPRIPSFKRPQGNLRLRILANETVWLELPWLRILDRRKHCSTGTTALAWNPTLTGAGQQEADSSPRKRPCWQACFKPFRLSQLSVDVCGCLVKSC